MQLEIIESLIIDVPDFPKPGVTFKDLTPLLANRWGLNSVADYMMNMIPHEVDAVIGLESRGFILGTALAMKLYRPFVPIRKAGKLPRKIFMQQYKTEYSTDIMEIHQDALENFKSIVIVDDILATGGTAQAAERLCFEAGAKEIFHCFLIELEFLKGGEKLKSPYVSLIKS